MATTTTLTTIDADTHIDETEDTWEYMAASEEQFKPVVGYPSNPSPNRATQRFWVIDGDRQPRLHREDARTMTTVETRELIDVKSPSPGHGRTQRSRPRYLSHHVPGPAHHQA